MSDLTRDGRLSTYDESVLKLSKVLFCCYFIYLGARDARKLGREKSLGQNNFGYNRSHGRNLSSALGQGEFIPQHFSNKMDHWLLYVHLSIEP